ncbi:hypothetical protein ACHAXA_003300 [Cyclostephanos tholiformis]|uniref:peptidylprolyl isomerase n=1 Tax=Cyclostephanos tholiformis TaxID=382380 RepID=A0ABD3R2V0_9STRA
MMQRQLRQHDEGFATLTKGVQYMDVSNGKGPIVIHRKNVRVSYTLRSLSHISGKILDLSRNFSFHFGKGKVIKGWDLGLVGMKVGGVPLSRGAAIGRIRQ